MCLRPVRIESIASPRRSRNWMSKLACQLGPHSVNRLTSCPSSLLVDGDGRWGDWSVGMRGLATSFLPSLGRSQSRGYRRDLLVSIVVSSTGIKGTAYRYHVWLLRSASGHQGHRSSCSVSTICTVCREMSHLSRAARSPSDVGMTLALGSVSPSTTA